MINVLLTGVGGQGTALASRMLAQAAQDKGWNVRAVKVTGMAQRGGSVVSHVRIGNRGEQPYSPFIAKASADMIIALEPTEGARMLPYLAPHGVLVTATTSMQTVASALQLNPYRGVQVIKMLASAFAGSPDRLVVVPDAAIMKRVGDKRVLNTVLLASALAIDFLPLSLEDLYAAVEVCVGSGFIDANLKAIDETLR